MRLLKPLAVCLAAASLSLPFCVEALAGAWDADDYFDNPDKSVKTLVVVGNFVKPRLLAEIARKDSKAPYVLLPAPGDSRLFFCPAGKGPALEIREGDLSKFIEFIKPFKIAVLGDSRFVPQSYLQSLEVAKAEIISIDSDNWTANATTLGNLLENHSIPAKFNSELAKIDSGKWSLDGLKGSSQGSAAKVQPAGASDSAAPALIEQRPEPAQAKPAAPPSSEPMVLMPPSDEPVLLVPATPKASSKGQGK